MANDSTNEQDRSKYKRSHPALSKPLHEHDDGVRLSGTGETAPEYGSKQYWEDRYKRFKVMESSTGTAADIKEGPDPQHAWYFTYQDLAPLILPLILGEGNVPDVPFGIDTATESSEEEEPDDASSARENSSPKKDDKDKRDLEGEGSEQNVEAEDDDDGPEEADIDDESEASEEAPERPGIARSGPIEVLEVGCGDVPLGSSLLDGLVALEPQLEKKVPSILKQVVCMDYSESVITALRDSKNVKQENDLRVIYDVEDARKMSYDNERFGLILEKGTMDAMLSDEISGPENCRSIVSEMARVLTVGGCILIVSHINAHEQKGLDWLESIVVAGLRMGAGSNEWRIEVHCSEIPDDEGESGSNGDLGPAVYLIHKGECNGDARDESNPPTIPLRFLSY